MSTLFRRSAQRILWGEGTIERLPEEMVRLRAERALIVCGGSVARHPRLLPRLTGVLGEAIVGVSTDVRAHSPLGSIDEVAEAIRASGADVILAVGGGSTFVSARAAVIRHGEGRPLPDLATQFFSDGTTHSPRLLQPKVPILAVPTTPTTATGKAGTAITTAGLGARLTMLDPQTRARSILLDPEYLASSPASLVRHAALNALVMAVEGICSARAHEFSDALLIHAVRRLSGLLPELSREPDSPEHRMAAARISLLVAEGTDSTGGGLTAALSHTIGHQIATHNAAVDAVLLPHVLEMVKPGPAALRHLAEALGGTDHDVLDPIRGLLSAADAPSRLRDLGVERAVLGSLAREATRDFAYGHGAHRPPEDAAINILHAAW